MIVDDHADMRRVLKHIVSQSETEIEEFIECAHGEEALSNYKTHKPDCVLMDIELKSMSGFQVVEEIYGEDPDAKIIMVTSYDTPTFRRKAKELHTEGFVCKDNLKELNQLLLNISHQ